MIHLMTVIWIVMMYGVVMQRLMNVANAVEMALVADLTTQIAGMVLNIAVIVIVLLTLMR